MRVNRVCAHAREIPYTQKNFGIGPLDVSEAVWCWSHPKTLVYAFLLFASEPFNTYNSFLSLAATFASS